MSNRTERKIRNAVAEARLIDDIFMSAFFGNISDSGDDKSSDAEDLSTVVEPGGQRTCLNIFLK